MVEAGGLASGLLLEGAAGLHRALHEGGLGHIPLQVLLILFKSLRIWVSLEDLLDLFDVGISWTMAGGALTTDLRLLLLSGFASLRDHTRSERLVSRDITLTRLS